VEWLEQLPMNAAKVNQWQATIQNAKGIRQEEIDQADVGELLSQFADNQKLSKGDLLNHIENNLRACMPILGSERARQYSPTLLYKKIPVESLPPKVINMLNGQKVIHAHVMPYTHYRMVQFRFNSLFSDMDRWIIFDPKWKLIRSAETSGLYKTSLEAIDAMHSAVSKRFDGFVSNTTHNEFEQYSLLGGRKYREWFVCINHWNEKYNDNHFRINNLLLHLRTSEWMTDDGIKLLLVDEMQSDWHAHKKTEKDVPNAPFEKDWHELAIKAACSIAAQLEITRIAFTTSEHHAKRYGYDYDGFKILYDQMIPKALNKLKQTYGGSSGWTTITVKTPIANLIRDRNQGWVIEIKEDKAITKGIQNQSVALSYLKAKSDKRKESVHFLEISTELVQQLKTKGLPLYGW
jgi:hypothetical protein